MTEYVVIVKQPKRTPSGCTQTAGKKEAATVVKKVRKSRPESKTQVSLVKHCSSAITATASGINKSDVENIRKQSDHSQDEPVSAPSCRKPRTEVNTTDSNSEYQWNQCKRHCPICRKSFGEDNALGNHLKHTHGMNHSNASILVLSLIHI